MEKRDYERIIERHRAYETRLTNAIIAFLVGGFVGVVAEGLSDFYSSMFNLSVKDSYTLMIVTLIFISCLLTSLGIFDRWVNFARCGLIIPITGFAHSVMSAALDYKNEGPIYGVGSNIFRLAGSVILYGIVSAVIFGSIRFLLFGGV